MKKIISALTVIFLLIAALCSALQASAQENYLPSSYNSNPEDPMHMTSVKNQGKYGICWAFAAIACCESEAIKNHGANPDEITQSLAQGNRALEQEAFLRTTVVHAPAEYLSWLEREGWVCWNSTLDLTPAAGDAAGTFARRTLTRLEGRTKATYLSLDVSEHTLRVLPTLLAQLEDAGFELALPLETRL